jgi:hypothetical protein
LAACQAITPINFIYPALSLDLLDKPFEISLTRNTRYALRLIDEVKLHFFHLVQIG